MYLSQRSTRSLYYISSKNTTFVQNTSCKFDICVLIVSFQTSIIDKSFRQCFRHGNAACLLIEAAVTHSVESTAPDRRARIPGFLGEKPSCTLMAPGVYKTYCGSNVLQVPILFIPLRLLQGGRGAIPSVLDHVCDGMSPDHLSE